MLELNASIFGREVPVGFGVMGLALVSWAILKGTPSTVQGGSGHPQPSLQGGGAAAQGGPAALWGLPKSAFPRVHRPPHAVGAARV